MARAAGRKGTARDPLADVPDKLLAHLAIPGLTDGDDAGQEREEGIGEPRDIPGGRDHLANPPVVVEGAPKKHAAWQYSRADLAHGVPPDVAGYWEADTRLAHRQRGGAGPLHHEISLPSPVPVYLVEGAGGARTLRQAVPRSLTVPANTTAEPVRVCSRNDTRVEIRLLNEDGTNGIRFASTLAALSSGTGALLPKSATSYLTLPGQNDLWAVSDGAATAKLSVVEIYEQITGP